MIPSGMEFIEPDEVFELTDGAIIELAGLRLKFLHTPGHTPGSLVAIVNENLSPLR